MTTFVTKTQKNNERAKTAVVKPTLNCLDFTQSITPDLKQLDNFLFVEYVGQRHIYPQRISSARQKDVSSLKVTYFTPDHISFVQQASDSLQKLDLSNSALFKLPYGIIYNMTQLQVLILDNNQLNELSFCKEFCHVLGNSLRELSICYNALSSWPDNVHNLLKLSRLRLKNNFISSIKGIEKFKRLKMLNLEQNQLSQLGNSFYQIKRLEYLYAPHNQLTSVSVVIKQMIYLKEIDLSFNSLKSIPPDIFLLDHLEILKLNDNKIGKLQKFKPTGKQNKTLILVDLSNNNIVRFPECVLKITEELDLSNNKLRIIPPNIIKKIPYKTTQKLILTNNPLSNPPKEICESGLKCMIQYYLETETVAKSQYGLKVFCLGSDKIDKLHIITSLTDQHDEETSLTEKENIIGIVDTAFEVSEESHSTNKLLNLQFVDIDAENNDASWLMLFSTFPSMIMLFVDVDTYSKASFMDTIGLWLQHIIIKQNEISLMLVGVSNIKTYSNQMDVLNAIKSDVTDFFQDYLDKINCEIHHIESQTKITTSMSLTLKKFILLKSSRILFHENCVLINSKRPKSYVLLQKEIIKMATTNFKNVNNSVPSFWSDAQLYFEEEACNHPIMTIDEYEILIHQKFNLKPSALKIANFLHESGYFLWWEKAQKPLNQWIISCPLSVINCLRVLFRSDLRIYLADPLDPDRMYKRYKTKFSKSKYTYKECCNILLNKAILLPELATVLWEHILPLKCIPRMLYYLCECWSLGYITTYPYYLVTSWMNLPKENNELYFETNSSIDSSENRLKSAESTKSNKSSLNKMPPVFIPRFLTRNKCLEEVEQQWNSKSHYNICVLYKFPIGLPKIISNQILVRSNNKEKYKTHLTDHWIEGIQAEIDNTNVLFRITRQDEQDGPHFMRYEFRYIDDFSQIDLHSHEAKKYSAVMWERLLQFLQDTDEFLDTYKGLWYERLIECPYCERGSFQGTWNANNDSSPKEDQICHLCDELLPSYILYSPKLSKDKSSEEIIRNMRRQYNRE